MYLGTKDQSNASLMYLTPYVSKNKVAVEQILSTIQKAMEYVQRKGHESVAEDSGTDQRTLQHILTRTINQLDNAMEFSDTQMAASLLDYGAELTMDIFTYYSPHQAVNYTLHQQGKLLNPPLDNACAKCKANSQLSVDKHKRSRSASPDGSCGQPAYDDTNSSDVNDMAVEVEGVLGQPRGDSDRDSRDSTDTSAANDVDGAVDLLRASPNLVQGFCSQTILGMTMLVHPVAGGTNQSIGKDCTMMYVCEEDCAMMDVCETKTADMEDEEQDEQQDDEQQDDEEKCIMEDDGGALIPNMNHDIGWYGFYKVTENDCEVTQIVNYFDHWQYHGKEL